jgi:hypothetical protein
MRWITVVLFACSHPTPPVPQTLPVVPVDAPAVVSAPADAPPPAPPQTKGPQTFRDVLVPEPLKLGPPSPEGKRCVDNAKNYEHDREIATLDAKLRKNGGYVLRVERITRSATDPVGTVGTVFRGWQGQRFMLLGQVGCGMALPTWAMTGGGEVFDPSMMTIRSRHRRSVTQCLPDCGGCGMNQLPELVAAEVPDNAHIASQAGTIDEVEMDVEVFVTPSANRCVPRP